jgi:hypothetical protein
VPAVILMPSDAPPAKRAATRGYGADVIDFDRYAEDRDALLAGLERVERELEVDRTGELDVGRVELGQSAGERSGKHDREVSFDVDVVRREHDRGLGLRCLETAA